MLIMLNTIENENENCMQRNLRCKYLLIEKEFRYSVDEYSAQQHLRKEIEIFVRR